MSLSIPTQPSRFSGWIILLGALMALGPLSIDMYLPGLPQIASDLGSTAGTAQLTLASYFIGLAIGQSLYGPLSDHYGRKPLLLAGLALYALASAGCALASQIDQLVALRFVQALGGCAGMVITRAIVRDRTSPTEAAQIYSTLVLVMGVAPILAPVLGSWFVVHTGWRSIFATLTVFAVLCMAAIIKMLEETRPRIRDRRFSLSEVGRTYALLMRDRAFLTYALTGGLSVGGMFAYITGSPVVIMQGYNLSPTHYALLFGSVAACYIAASQFNARFVRLHGLHVPMAVALTVQAIATLVLMLATAAGFLPLPLLMLCLYAYLCALGFIAPNATAAALTHHGERAGSASSLLGTLQFTIATLSGVLMGLWHSQTALPLATILLLSGCGAWLVHRLGTRTRPTLSEAA
ncbi:Bcr/CflA family multidrug efflux MFS transporter [Chitinibacteraceae bacterium HSL-7]